MIESEDGWAAADVGRGVDSNSSADQFGGASATPSTPSRGMRDRRGVEVTISLSWLREKSSIIASSIESEPSTGSSAGVGGDEGTEGAGTALWLTWTVGVLGHAVGDPDEDSEDVVRLLSPRRPPLGVEGVVASMRRFLQDPSSRLTASTRMRYGQRQNCAM